MKTTETHIAHPEQQGSTEERHADQPTPSEATGAGQSTLEAAIAALEPDEKRHYDHMLAGFRAKAWCCTWLYRREMLERMLRLIEDGQSAPKQWNEHAMAEAFLHPVATLSKPSEKAAELAIRTVLNDLQEVCGAIDALKAMEDDVRAVVQRLDLKDRTVVGVLVKLAGMEGLSCGIDFGNDLLYGLEDDDAIKAGCFEFADDPDIRIVAKAYQLACRIPE
jgi:hypothetical protein